jgi:mannose-6-phosphate isomerase-like protein (cupin superfamily)
MKKFALSLGLLLSILVLAPHAQQGAPAFTKNPLAQRISHTNPANFRPSPAVHNGPGQLDYMALFGGASLDTNLWFLHHGVIEPKSGIGGHFHNYCEEMFVIFDGEAQYTIDGRTSTLKGPAGAPSRMGHWHAIYNATDKPVEWMNINVSLYKNQYDAFNLNDGRVDAPLDKIPQFMTMQLDRALLRPQMTAGTKGDVKYRRALDPTVFLGPWGYVDHYLLAPGAATAPSTDKEIGGFYYVMAGKGKVTIGAETADIVKGDAVPILLNDTKSFENTGTEPLELMTVGIVSDMTRRNEILNPNAGAPRGGGGGGGGGRNGGGRAGAAATPGAPAAGAPAAPAAAPAAGAARGAGRGAGRGQQ